MDDPLEDNRRDDPARLPAPERNGRYACTEIAAAASINCWHRKFQRTLVVLLIDPAAVQPTMRKPGNESGRPGPCGEQDDPRVLNFLDAFYGGTGEVGE